MKDKYLDEFYSNINALQEVGNYIVSEVEEDIFCIEPFVKCGDTFAFLAITHGDEIAGIGILNSLLNKLINNEVILNNKVYLILANKRAYLDNVRLLEHDLNRSYSLSSSTTWEEQRAHKITKILDECDISIDFHQTIEPTISAFYIIPDNTATYNFVSSLNINIPIMINPVKEKPTTSSSYMEHNDKIGVTVEVGDSGMEPEDIKVGEQVILSALRVKSIQGSKTSTGKILKVKYHKDNNNNVVTYDAETKNLMFVKRGQKIGTIDGNDLLVEEEGFLLLYPRKMINAKQHCPGIYIICSEIGRLEI